VPGPEQVPVTGPGDERVVRVVRRGHGVGERPIGSECGPGQVQRRVTDAAVAPVDDAADPVADHTDVLGTEVRVRDGRPGRRRRHPVQEGPAPSDHLVREQRQHVQPHPGQCLQRLGVRRLGVSCAVLDRLGRVQAVEGSEEATDRSAVRRRRTWTWSAREAGVPDGERMLRDDLGGRDGERQQRCEPGKQGRLAPQLGLAIGEAWSALHLVPLDEGDAVVPAAVEVGLGLRAHGAEPIIGRRGGQPRYRRDPSG
jgi:hypothetical protein